MTPQDLSVDRGAAIRPVAGAWDPYDVWLRRVKEPREQQPRRGVPAPVLEAAPTAAADAAGDDAMLLPGVT